MERRRMIWTLVTVAVVAATAALTYLAAVGSPEVLEPGPRSTAHEGIDCHRCHEAYSGVEDALCLDCHYGADSWDWHTGVGGGEDCADCHYEHVGTDYITDLTRFTEHDHEHELSYLHDNLRCTSCHWSEGVVEDCSWCHGPYIEGTHQVGFADDCELCHLQADWDVVYDHDHSTEECLDCHGTDQDHPHPGYLEWSLDCEACHGTEVWLLPEFAHEAIGEPCELCHATSLCPQWGGTSGSCGDCHSVDYWRPAEVEHDDVEAECSRCHLEDLPPDHITTAEMAPLDCDVCHGTEEWSRTIQHARYPQPCTTCHLERPEEHGDTYADDCDWCHGTDTWSLLEAHPDQSADCAMCHEDVHAGGDAENSVDGAHSTLCGACHLADTTWETLLIDHDPLGLDCAACHVSTHDAIGGRSAGCGDCHSVDYWLPVTPDHDAWGDDCQSCHLTPHPNAYDQWSQDCTVCHGTLDWKLRTWDHSPRNQTGTPCVNCHDDIHRGTLGIACEECHTTDTWETEVINP